MVRSSEFNMTSLQLGCIFHTYKSAVLWQAYDMYIYLAIVAGSVSSLSQNSNTYVLEQQSLQFIS